MIWLINYTANILYCQFSSMLCAFGDGKGTCSGDSGGPLFLRENGRLVMCSSAQRNIVFNQVIWGRGPPSSLIFPKNIWEMIFLYFWGHIISVGPFFFPPPEKARFSTPKIKPIWPLTPFCCSYQSKDRVLWATRGSLVISALRASLLPSKGFLLTSCYRSHLGQVRFWFLVEFYPILM